MSRPTRAISKAMKLLEFLQSIIDEPPSLTDCRKFATHLKTQGAMAAFTAPELGMESISLNALKAASAECFDDGFKRLDTVRLRALVVLKEKINPTSKQDKRNKDSLLMEIDNLKEDKKRLEGNLMILTQALRLSIGLGEKYVRLTNKPEYREAFNFERLELLEMLSYSERR
ncbi:hypothetical protein ACQKPT_17130 [Pseudomonas monteilii]|uniref:hypothetical protein n=1 Tax=Pseudomonas monteilii TaxID=76759 RepID=UPI003D07ED06